VTAPQPLTPRQKHVLLVLAQRGPTAIPEPTAWFPLNGDQVRGIIRAFGHRRGPALVDVAGFDATLNGARTYKITPAGLALIDGADADEVEAALG
jgi:hypothetical protein